MVLRFYPSKDATIYEDAPTQNTGLDAILELNKTVVRAHGTSSIYNSRILLDFDLIRVDQVLADIGRGRSEFEWNLKLFAANSSEIPLDYDVECYTVGQQWGMGIGRRLNRPQTTQGASWTFSTGVNTPLSAWPTSSFSGGTTGSWQTNPGGGVWNTTPVATASLAYRMDDINFDVTLQVKGVNAKSFTGFLIKRDQASESSEEVLGSLRLFSMDTSTVYVPILEARVLDFLEDNTLQGVSVTYDDYNVVAHNLRESYEDNSTPTFYFSGRERYPAITHTTSSNYLVRQKLPAAQYSISDAHSDLTIIEFSEYTKLSDDGLGSYFSLPLASFQPERYYRVKLKIPYKDEASFRVVDNNWIFKVARASRTA